MRWPILIVYAVAIALNTAGTAACQHHVAHRRVVELEKALAVERALREDDERRLSGCKEWTEQFRLNADYAIAGWTRCNQRCP